MKNIGKEVFQITVSAVATATLVFFLVRVFGSPISTGAMSQDSKQGECNTFTTINS